MDVIESGNIIICGNFAELLPSKPKNFDYMSNAKWLEPYPFERREVIGGTICSCDKVEWWHNVYWEPDVFHLKTCNLMKKLRDNPGLANLWAYEHLPQVAFSSLAVPADTKVKMYISYRSRTYRVRVRRTPPNRTLSLFA